MRHPKQRKTPEAAMRKNKAAATAPEQRKRPEGPVRMCVICRRRFSKADVNRHVLTPQGNLSIDVEKTRPGRGWYVCSDPVCERKFAKYRPGTRRAAAVARGTSVTDADSSDAAAVARGTSVTDADSSDAAADKRKKNVALAVAAQPLTDKDSSATVGDSIDKGGNHA